MQINDINALTGKIFSCQPGAEFERLAMDVFRFQCNNNAVYSSYIKALGKSAENISRVEDIPFLPVSFFKSHEVVCGKGPYDKMFYSSTTTGGTPSKHIVKDIAIYRESFRKGFLNFYGDIKEYCILALLPSYLERDGSSLVYMAEDMVKQSGHADSGFYIHNYTDLVEKLKMLEKKGQKVILLGVTYALLKLAEEYPMPLKHTLIMETGGMKGKRKEMPRQEVHKILKNAFGVEHIHSEYGMTELLSQAYSKGEGVFYCPPWMRIAVRDLYDPFRIEMHKGTGAVNIIDFANINSCSFIATDDIGMLSNNGSFQISGRIDHSDVRGCNLMAEEL